MEWDKREDYCDFLIKNGAIGFLKDKRRLSSGRMSNWYANFRRIINYRQTKHSLLEFLASFVETMLDLHEFPRFDYFLGVPESMTCVAESLNERFGFERLVKIRSKPKNHGDPADRYFLGEVREGDKAVLLEDVTTTGDSLYARWEQCCEAGVRTVATVALLNRVENIKCADFGVEELFRRKGIHHFSLIDANYALPKAVTALSPSEDIVNAVEKEYKRHGVKPIVLISQNN
ncbi:hypothetical protein KY328_02725 [Candidatus Woesearchaeota archaeon]|nr:hypothetical protein [Candidatus Woesearchaeota archaeon]MBW3021807.1 hypothetical protein [Candidatus Woesearchaeota archaeon]